MKNIIKFVTVFMFVILYVTTSSSFAQAGKTNFSGTWAFNESKSSQAEGGVRFTATQMVIAQDGNNLTNESTRKNRDGQDVKSTSKFTLDGKECENPGFGNSTRKSVVTWSADGKTLGFAHTSKFEMNGETREMKSTESWKLNDDKTLSVETVFNGPNGEMKMTNVYDKK